VSRYGTGLSHLFRQQAKDWMKAAEVARRKAIDESTRLLYMAKDEHECFGVTRIGPDGRKQYRLEMCERMARGPALVSYGYSAAEAVSRMHMGLAQHYHDRKLCPTWEACLDRAAEATVRVLEWRHENG